MADLEVEARLGEGSYSEVLQVSGCFAAPDSCVRPKLCISSPVARTQFVVFDGICVGNHLKETPANWRTDQMLLP